MNDYKVSTENLKYLQKIVYLLENKGINVVLIRSPQRSDYEFWANEAKYQKILKQEFENVDYLDFSKFPLKNEEYLDASHLNYKGARRFSYWFDRMLKTGLLEPNNRSRLIKSIEESNN